MSETQEENNNEQKKEPRKHLIRVTWLRRTLKTLMWMVIAILLIPVLLYIPPVQDLAVKIASNYIEKSTGMKVGIGKFRLYFPLDVHLKDVYVVEASKDTMVRAKEVIADVKLLPLLSLDVKLNRLQLNDGYYRMVSSDSSMVLKINAGLLEVDDKSSANIRKSEILLNRVKLRDGSLSMFMDVWKKKPTPPDTAPSTPFLIKANDLDIENFRFAMSMLPTIDTLDANVRHVVLKRGVVDLRKNLVNWQLAALRGGSFTYLTPTAEYIKTHPAPPPEPSTGPPMRIMGDSIAVDSLKALYAVKGSKPLPGFDASHISVDGVNIGMRNFYNESSTVRLPITRLQARERCGLQITRGSGLVGIDSIGLTLDKLDIATLFSKLKATASVPFALMAMEEDAPLDAELTARIGIPDVEAFMPALKQYTRIVPGRKPLDIDLKANGSLRDVNIPRLLVSMPGVVSLKANGKARNPLDVKRLVAKIDFDGSLSDPSLASSFVDTGGIKIPAFTIKGSANAAGTTYGADFDLISTAGDLAAKGRVALTPEEYTVDLDSRNINVGEFFPSLGIGRVTATVRANGRGFNPLSGTAVTDAIIDIHSIEYNKRELSGIHLNASLLADGLLTLAGSSANPGLDFDIDGSGKILPDNYTFDVAARMRDVNLQMLGLSDSLNNGSGYVHIAGNASPDQWLYDVNLDIEDFDWNLPNQYIHLPNGLTATLKSDITGTSLDVNSLMTNLGFESPAGLQSLIASFTKASDIVMAQMKEKNLAVDSISKVLPDFRLALNASGRGMLHQFLQPSGIAIDTLYADISKDSIIMGNVGLLNLTTPSMALDTIGLDFKERGNLLDYSAHLGNRPGTLDEFARVNLRGYLGQNRASAFLNQYNIKGEQGYRIGLTAAFVDSVISAHITPLKSTIAYLPWTFNDDNFVDFNVVNKHIDANLVARSAESSITAKTQTDSLGREEFYANIHNVHIQDFLSMWAFAPRMTGDLNADLHVRYDNNRFEGIGSVGMKNFIYEKVRVGDLDLGLKASYGFEGSTDVNASLMVNDKPAMTAYANLRGGEKGMEPDSIGVTLTRFPLSIANPFLGETVSLGGYLNGNMRMEGSFSAPLLNGEISMDSVTAHIPMFDATLRFGKDPLSVVNNLISIDNFDIFAANGNPLTIKGTVDARKFSDLAFDLGLNASNFQLIKTDKRSKGDVFGKIFLNLDGSVKGPMSRLDINGNVNILGNTDATYRLNMEGSELTAQADENVVKFVNFNDTTQVQKADTLATSPLNMRINAHLVISPGTQIEVLLSNNGTDKVEAQPSANLNFSQNYMGDMNMTGTLTLGTGFARYSLPVIGEKMFDFDPNSTITWRGNVTNPVLNVTATDNMKANVSDGNNSRLVNFLVTLHATDALDRLKVSFDLSTNDDLTIENELQSMSADQRQTQAMNLLLYGQYVGQNTKANAKLEGNILYSYLESQLNSWAAKNVRGVELTFGINQYDKTTEGVTNTETSYSYQVSKSLFNNKFKIQVGGNYSTDAADEDIAQNLVSDVAFEYTIKQTQTSDMAVRLFRHQGFESILEGEVTEMGVGFVYKKRLENLKSLFRFRRKKRKQNAAPPQDTTLVTAPRKDSVGNK